MNDERKTLWDYGAHAPGPPLSGHVLVGVDGSERATRALDRAAEEARVRRTPLEILHGWPWARHGVAVAQPGKEDVRCLIDRAQSVLEFAAGRVHERVPGLDVVTTLSPEPAASELVRRGEGAALTVVGNRGLGRATGLLAGSVSLSVAAHCGSPLLVVRGESEQGGPADATVLVGIADETDAGAGAARFAFEEAHQLGARVRVLHMCSVPELSGSPGAPRPGRPEPEPNNPVRIQETGDAVPRATVAALREKFPEVGVRFDTVWRDAADALVDATRAADTVVITAHRHSGRGHGRQLGPVEHALLHRAHCPVALVPVAWEP
ncbi:universal stress protein [Streptomyces sp. NPDC050549]|uniref:universal stress protein n=1 Tax=Streptomyces sp. NPDC050549 TaxID=3155406 RepID=UPI00343BF341